MKKFFELLFKEFIKKEGRKPNNLEMILLKQKAMKKSIDEKKVIQFPQDRITDWTKPRPAIGKKADITELDKPLVNEFAGPPHGYGAGHGTADSIQAQRIRQGFSTQSKLNSWSQNQRWVKDFIGRKNAEFNFLKKEDQTKVLEMFEVQIKKHMPKEPKAYGGVAGLLGERTGYDNGELVEGPYMPSKNFYNIGFDSILDKFAKGKNPKKSWSGKDILSFIDMIKEGGDLDKDDLMLHIIRENPEKRSTLFLGAGKDRIEGGYKKNIDFNKWLMGKADGGIAGMLGEPTYADGGRTGFKGKKFDPKRRGFLKVAAGLATIPFISKYFKWAKPLAKSSKVLTSVPIKTGADGMPVWFPKLADEIIKKGKQIESGAERVIVHEAKLPGSGTKMHLTQDLTSGDVAVEIGSGKHGFSAGHHGQPVRLEYKASEWIEPTINTKTKKVIHKGTKTKDEFWVEEAEFTGGHPENVKFEESTFNKFGEHGSDFSEVEKFATGKVKKVKPTKKKLQTEFESGKAEADADRWADDVDMASGGRVPLAGGLIVKGGNWLIKSLLGTRQQLKTMNLSPGQLKQYLDQIDDQIRRIKAGEKIPDEVIQTIRSDPKFKSVWQNQKSSDPDLREMEEVLLEYGKKHASGGRVSLASDGLAGMLGE